MSGPTQQGTMYVCHSRKWSLFFLLWFPGIPGLPLCSPRTVLDLQQYQHSHWTNTRAGRGTGPIIDNDAMEHIKHSSCPPTGQISKQPNEQTCDKPSLTRADTADRVCSSSISSVTYVFCGGVGVMSRVGSTPNESICDAAPWQKMYLVLVNCGCCVAAAITLACSTPALVESCEGLSWVGPVASTRYAFFVR